MKKNNDTIKEEKILRDDIINTDYTYFYNIRKTACITEKVRRECGITLSDIHKIMKTIDSYHNHNELTNEDQYYFIHLSNSKWIKLYINKAIYFNPYYSNKATELPITGRELCLKVRDIADTLFIAMNSINKKVIEKEEKIILAAL
jgi:hypothetical protein